MKEGRKRKGPVLYWMSRDQRVRDNWALIYAQDLAVMEKKPLVVVFCLAPRFLDATFRQYQFMIQGLKNVEWDLKEKNIPFFLLQGYPVEELLRFVERHNISMLVSDFDPLKIKREWKQRVQDAIRISFYEVDARNIVPCWLTSQKQEYAAYTIRPKIKRLLPEFLDVYPNITRHPYTLSSNRGGINWSQAIHTLTINWNVKPVEWIKAGEDEAHETLKEFMKRNINKYHKERNDPTKNVLSNLSPYLHFGQISAQRVALEIEKGKFDDAPKEAFLEELIVRRELADNFCNYSLQYDTPECFPNWAKETHSKHRKDKRMYLYSLEQLENAQTHDPLWNAAQEEMVKRGKMHGYMRMYWAKKILEWTQSVEEAMEHSIYLNDKYELDGRESNGYAGIAWALGGIHDRPWFERPIFGKIRYMSYNGCKSKFNIQFYIENVEKLMPDDG